MFVPVLPCFGSFLEFPAAPTPYIIGVHSSFRRLLEHMHADCLQDCLKVDLDGGSVHVPQAVDELICGSASDYAPHSSERDGGGYSNSSPGKPSHKAKSTYGLPHHLYESTLNLLFQVLKPDVLRADEIAEFCRPASQPSAAASLHHHQQKQDQPSSHESQSNASSSATSHASVNGGGLFFVSQLNSSAQAQLISSAATTGSDSTAAAAAAGVAAGTADSASLLLTTNVNHLASGEIEAVWQDKLIRAVFVRLFAQMFAGYRYCLLIIRINPRPVICFDKATFLGNHGLADNEFMNRVLDSMSFQRFIEERGPSYRHCDVFDDLYAAVQSQLAAELQRLLAATHYQQHDLSDSLAMRHLRHIAEKLYKYEYPQTVTTTTTTGTTRNAKELALAAGHDLLTTPNRSYSKIKLPTIDAYRRIHSETFPLLDANYVQKLILNNQQVKHFDDTGPSKSSTIPANNLAWFIYLFQLKF